MRRIFILHIIFLILVQCNAQFEIIYDNKKENIKLTTNVSPPEWINISAKEEDLIYDKAQKISGYKRKFDMIQYVEYAKFSSQEQYDMLLHSSQYLGGGNKFGWVVLEQIDKTSKNKIIFEEYSNLADGKFIRINEEILLEVFDNDDGSNEVYSSLYKWKDNKLCLILKYLYDIYMFQSHNEFSTYRIFDKEDKSVHIITYERNGYDPNDKYGKFTIDYYKWVEKEDKYVINKKNVKFTKEKRDLLVKKDPEFKQYLGDKYDKYFSR